MKTFFLISFFICLLSMARAQDSTKLKIIEKKVLRIDSVVKNVKGIVEKWVDYEGESFDTYYYEPSSKKLAKVVHKETGYNLTVDYYFLNDELIKVGSAEKLTNKYILKSSVYFEKRRMIYSTRKALGGPVKEKPLLKMAKYYLAKKLV